MAVGTYVYPWDVVGDAAAAERVAALGVDEVALAAAYHSTRALTPRHPQHRIVFARHAALYCEPDDGHWAGSALRPAAPDWIEGPDSFGTAAAELRRAGLRVHAWTVLAHNTRLGDLHPQAAVHNAFGDRYPWALCISNDDVHDYAARLVSQLAARPDVDGLELEACGWYGFDHQSPHDKTGGVRLGAGGQFLLSLCFCAACGAAYRDGGVDPDRLRAVVRERLDESFRAGRGMQPADSEWDEVEQLLGAELAAAVLSMRRQVADRFRADVIAAARTATGRPLPITVQAHPEPHRYGANVGVDADTALQQADGLVLSCWRDMAAAEADVARVAAAAGPHDRIVASFLAVAGMGGDMDGLRSRIERARKCGATDLRFYHAGLAAAADLELMASAIAADREEQRQ
jgi:hypothetical protein